MKKGTTKTVFAAFSITLLMAACKQDAVGDMVSSSKALQVALNESYMPAAKIDSALAIWEVNGTTQTVKLQQTANALTTSLDSFKKSGAGMLTVQLFSQTKIGNEPLQWEKRFTYTLDRAKPVSLTAPANIKDAAWNPRVISKYESFDGQFTAIIAVRPEDAYFELKGVAPAIAKRIEIVRSFFLNDTTTLVASRGWTGDASHLDTKGNLVDRQHFQNLMELLDGKEWDKFKVRATFYAQVTPHQIIEYEIEQDKP